MLSSLLQPADQPAGQPASQPLLISLSVCTHTTTAVSVDSACTKDCDSSLAGTSGSTFWMRKNRKLPTKLMTVREIKTVVRSLSGTHTHK